MSAQHRNDSGMESGAFVLGLLTGTLIGAAFAILFAPKPGADLRQDLADGAKELGRAARDKWDEASAKASEAVEKGREAYDEAVAGAREAAEEVGQSSDRVKKAVNDMA